MQVPGHEHEAAPIYLAEVATHIQRSANRPSSLSGFATRFGQDCHVIRNPILAGVRAEQIALVPAYDVLTMRTKILNYFRRSPWGRHDQFVHPVIPFGFKAWEYALPAPVLIKSSIRLVGLINQRDFDFMVDRFCKFGSRSW
jgi:hypothetical protein